MVQVERTGRLPHKMSQALVESLVNRVFRVVGEKGRARMSLSVVDDRTIRRLNRKYRHKDRVTDVLSFPYEEGSPFIVESGEQERHLGEIVIGVEQVRKQARRIGRPVGVEFALMVVHGTLHLLGYDHENTKDEKVMFGIQHEVMTRAGLI